MYRYIHIFFHLRMYIGMRACTYLYMYIDLSIVDEMTHPHRNHAHTHANICAGTRVYRHTHISVRHVCGCKRVFFVCIVVYIVGLHVQIQTYACTQCVYVYVCAVISAKKYYIVKINNLKS